MMRIVDVCAFFTPHGGGVKTYIDRKFAAAAAAGHEMIVIAPGMNDGFERRGPGGVLATVAAPAFALDRRYRYFNDEAALHRALSTWQPDFVEASSPWSSASMVGRWQGAASRALVMHADPLSAYAYRWFGDLANTATIDRGFNCFWRHLRRLDQSFDLVVSASVNLTTRLSGGGLRKVVTIPMGVEPGVFSPTNRNEALRTSLLERCGLGAEATLLVGVGRYSPEKRWPMVIDAALAAGTIAPIGLLLVGDGRSRAGLRARTAGSPHIRIGDPVQDRAALATIVASADALVHGCEAETFCMVAAEARASGVPLIVPDRGGAADHAIAPPDLRYRAANGATLRDAMVAFARSRSDTPQPAPSLVRTMDQHFIDLFATYSMCRAELRAA